MSPKDSIHNSDRYILVEGPKWGNAEFYGEWLRAAAKAEALWNKALEDPDFEKKVERLSVIHIPDFGISATVMLSWLIKNFASFAIQLNGSKTKSD